MAKVKLLTAILSVTYQTPTESTPPGTPIEMDRPEVDRLTKHGFVVSVTDPDAEAEKKAAEKAAADKAEAERKAAEKAAAAEKKQRAQQLDALKTDSEEKEAAAKAAIDAATAAEVARDKAAPQDGATEEQLAAHRALVETASQVVQAAQAAVELANAATDAYNLAAAGATAGAGTLI